MAEVSDILKQIHNLPQHAYEQLVACLQSPTSLPHGSSSPLIVATPEVCGGVPRLIRTRIPVWTLERMRQLGATQEQILASYPSLRETDISAAWFYAATHGDEIEKQMRDNEEA
jgi:uncharacterized protein (DUF433 family)